MNIRGFGFKQCSALVCLVLVFAGCGNGGQMASVSGTVVCDGTPLPDGLVVFSSSSSTCSGKIFEGKYKVAFKEKPSLTLEECVITVFPPDNEVEYNPETNSEEPVSSDLDLSLFPDKYQSKSTSDLKFSPKPGDNIFDISLSNQ